MSRTTIAVNRKTKAELDKLGRKGESYDEIIDRLLQISREELELIDEVYKRIESTPRERYVELKK